MLATVHHHQPCRAVHGPRYCAAIEQRRAIRHLRPMAFLEEQRTGVRHRTYRVDWKLPHLKAQNERLRTRLAWLRSLPTPRPTSVAAAICQLWHPCGDALRVFTCESGLTTTAQNGQFLGFAQMGDYARGRYGHGADAWSQALAAFHYYQDAGWSPWTCARITGVI